MRERALLRLMSSKRFGVVLLADEKIVAAVDSMERDGSAVKLTLTVHSSCLFEAVDAEPPADA